MNYGTLQRHKMKNKFNFERRVRKMRRLFWDMKDDLGLMAVTFGLFGIGVMGWVCLDVVLGLFR